MPSKAQIKARKAFAKKYAKKGKRGKSSTKKGETRKTARKAYETKYGGKQW